MTGPMPASSTISGHGSGATGWAPIMGNGYSRELTQWSKGEYPDANNSEDDLSIITTRNGFGYRPDDHGDVLAAATALNPASDTILAGEGIIERNTDGDYFSFATGAGTVALTVKPFERGPNLDVVATLYDRSGTVIATSNPPDRLDASFSVALTGGTYYLAIAGTGKGPLTTGYSDYGSLGYYSITGTLPPGGPPPYVVEVSPASATVINTRNVFVDVAFSKLVVKVDASDMVLSGSAAAAAYVSTPSNLGGNLWRFPVHTLADGSLQIHLAPDSNDIEDAAGNDLDPSPTVFTYTVADPRRDLYGRHDLRSRLDAVSRFRGVAMAVGNADRWRRQQRQPGPGLGVHGYVRDRLQPGRRLCEQHHWRPNGPRPRPSTPRRFGTSA